MTCAELARAIGVRSSSATLLADRLETARLVARNSHPTDRRAVVLRATPTGQSLIAGALGPTLERLARLVAGLGPRQLAAVVRFLNEVAVLLDESLDARGSGASGDGSSGSRRSASRR
jgi:DNA-binding MarR family transcriptional regulator